METVKNYSFALDESEKAWMAAGDLMFKNFRECHFINVINDVRAFCNSEVDDEEKISDHEGWRHDFDFDTSLDDEVKDYGRCTGKSAFHNMKANTLLLVH